MDKVCAIVMAAGSSSRMGPLGDKLTKTINGRSVVALAVDAFVRAGISRVLVVVPRNRVEEFSSLFDYPVELVGGGSSRQESVYLGLQALAGRCEYVLIHDGARPFVSTDLIIRVFHGTREQGACIPGLPVVDTTYRVEDHSGVEVLPREDLLGVQTPQGFAYNLIWHAHEHALRAGITATDDGGLVLALGHQPLMVPGERKNIKITTPEDMPLANIENRSSRMGLGIDVHRLVAGRPLVLGGVLIPSEIGLLGHSDADVVIHAVMDALLGAVGAGDIGEHFPDTDPGYKGISSMSLLERVAHIVQGQGATINNIDITLLLERPKISPYKEQMRGNIAAALGIPQELVNIKATTSEGLGYVGAGEGAVCHAVVSVLMGGSHQPPGASHQG